MFGLHPDSAAPFCAKEQVKTVMLDTVSQSFTLVSTPVQTLTLPITIGEVMSILDSLICNGVFNCAQAQTVAIAQSHIVNQTWNLTLSDTLGLTESLKTIIELSISQALTLLLEPTLVGYGQLDLVQSVTVNRVRDVDVTQSLTLVSNSILNYIINLEVCSCLELTQDVKKQIALAVAQSITFTLLEVMSVTQVLALLQTLTDNFNDSNVCCGLIGTPKDRKSTQDLAVAQSVTAKGVYNCRSTGSLTLQQTATWRV